MGAKADYVQRFTKGQRVLVVGRLEIGEWTTREGEKRTSFDIWADDVVNLSAREDGSRGQGEPATSGAPASRGQNVERLGDEELADLPF